MCCLVVVFVFLALCIMVFQLTIGLIVLDVALLILLIETNRKFQYTMQMKPSKMICDNCNSGNVKLSEKETGNKNQLFSAFQGIPKTSYRRRAECKDCGFVWDYLTQEDITNECKRLNALKNRYEIMLAVSAIITIWLFI